MPLYKSVVTTKRHWLVSHSGRKYSLSLLSDSAHDMTDEQLGELLLDLCAAALDEGVVSFADDRNKRTHCFMTVSISPPPFLCTALSAVCCMPVTHRVFLLLCQSNGRVYC